MKNLIVGILTIYMGSTVLAASDPEIFPKCISLNHKYIRQVSTKSGDCAFQIKANEKRDFQEFTLQTCPKPFNEKRIYIWTNIDNWQYDNIEITSSKHCDREFYRDLESALLARRESLAESLIQKKLKPKDSVSKLKKLHFFRIRTKDKVWTYHYSPGVSVDIEVTGEMCDGKICMDEKKQKFSKVLKTYVDFIWMDDNDEVYYSSALDTSDKSIKLNKEQ